MLPETLLNSDTICILSSPLCIKERESPSLILGSHTGSPDIVGLVPTSSFRCHPIETDFRTSKWVHITPLMIPKVNGTKHWVILCQFLNLSELSGAWHRVSVWGSFVEGIEWRKGGWVGYKQQQLIWWNSRHLHCPLFLPFPVINLRGIEPEEGGSSFSWAITQEICFYHLSF